MLQVHTATFNAFSENTYIIYNGEKECWIVDPGMYESAEVQSLQDFISGEGLKPRGIINTHAHLDHIFGVQAMMDAYGIPFALHPLEAPVLAGAKGSAMMFGFSFGDVPKPDKDIRESEALALGADNLEVRLAPGHSPGSVIFYYPAGGWAIGGDVLFAGSIGRSDLPGGNAETLLESIRTQLYTLPDDTVIYPGHGPETTIGREKKSNPFVRG